MDWFNFLYFDIQDDKQLSADKHSSFQLAYLSTKEHNYFKIEMDHLYVESR